MIDFFKSKPRGDSKAPLPADPKLKAMSDMWNTGFDTKTLPADPTLFLSNGPYIVKSMNQDQSLTMVRNKDYNWGPTPNLDEITVRYIGSAPAQVQALKNGEADIIAPQASADTLDQLKALSSQGVTVDQGNQLAFDHLDLNFSGPLADQNVRTAFMKTVPARTSSARSLASLTRTRSRWTRRSSFPSRLPTPTLPRTTARRPTRTWTLMVPRSS
ncbi:hypothetical protein AHiyo8_53000 [Arthrobacter sp. Hiyo8]|nr:hypothetical protein AHiyo8_53000 [Arthrobacter sp. Hiyo8]